MNMDQELRQRLNKTLEGKGAHLDYESVLTDFPEEFRGKSLPYLPYSAWQLLEHMRIAQWDILEFSRDPDHKSPEWPEEYWPTSTAPPDDEAWENSVNHFLRNLNQMQDLVNNPEIDLYKKIPHGSGQNILRETILVIDHNSYHLGQMVMLRKILESDSSIK
ncbi:MAG: DinB family protein [Calditrichaeota bacterium]|nr:MAG: DinB family protein [Calditrichota bacterium]